MLDPTEDEIAEWEADFATEQLPPTPVEERFVRAHYVSKTKGHAKGYSHGTKRKPYKTRQRRQDPQPRTHWQEVDLIADRADPKRPLRYRTEEKFPFDVAATEVYQDPEAESQRLRDDIHRL